MRKNPTLRENQSVGGMDDNGDGGNAADDDDDRNGHDAFLVVIVFGSNGKKQSFAYFASHLSMKDEK